MEAEQQANQPHHKVVIIRLPANYQSCSNNNKTSNNGNAFSGAACTATTERNNIPTIANINQFQLTDEIIAQMIGNQIPAPPTQTGAINIEPNSANDINQMNIGKTRRDNMEDAQMSAMFSGEHPNMGDSLLHNADNQQRSSKCINSQHQSTSKSNLTTNTTVNGTTTSATNNGSSLPVIEKSEEIETKDEGVTTKGGDDTVQYKNYTPKQREWMLVVLSYARGMLGKPFEIKLNDIVIEKARELLKKHAVDCNMDRIPTPKTLRSVWKNLWKHPDRTVSSVKKGGRPRIDPDLKRQKRNERERRRRAALREQKGRGSENEEQINGGQTNPPYQATNQSYAQLAPPVRTTTPRRSRRGPKSNN